MCHRRVDSGGENGQNVRRHSQGGPNASMIKQKKSPRCAASPPPPPLLLSPLTTLRPLSLRPSPPVSTSVGTSHRTFAMEREACTVPLHADCSEETDCTYGPQRPLVMI